MTVMGDRRGTLQRSPVRLAPAPPSRHQHLAAGHQCCMLREEGGRAKGWLTSDSHPGDGDGAASEQSESGHFQQGTRVWSGRAMCHPFLCICPWGRSVFKMSDVEEVDDFTTAASNKRLRLDDHADGAPAKMDTGGGGGSAAGAGRKPVVVCP